MTKLVTIFGGSGFVGRYIARRMAKEGWRVRVAVRRPNEAIFVRPYGTVGQVEPIFANIRDDDSVRAAIHGADAVVNCVGILASRGKNTFGLVQHHGAARIAKLAAEEGAGDVRPDFGHRRRRGQRQRIRPDQGAGRGRGAGGVSARRHPAAVNRVRPEDEFFNRFAKMTRMSPFLPVVGADTRFQPVYVDDVAQAAVMGVTGRAQPGIYELGGPEVLTFRELMQMMLTVIRRRRLIVNVPFWIAGIMGAAFDLLQAVTLGLFHNGLLTRDQVRNLRNDNVVSEGRKSFDDLGIHPTAMELVIEDYLWPYRPSGQYNVIRESADKLKRS
jgi:uncharacterized protein YbjT (DUF2867 family)